VDTDVDTSPLPSKRRRTQSTNTSSYAISTSSHRSHKPRDSPSIRNSDYDDAELPDTSQGKSTQRLHRKSTGKRQPPPPERTVDTTTAEVQGLKAELAKVRADAAAAVALAAEREPSGLGGSVDRLRSRGYSFAFAGCWRRVILNANLGFFLFVGAAVPVVVTRRPGASLANPNKAARRVTAVEFASDSDDA
jgi:hypothetical protein